LARAGFKGGVHPPTHKEATRDSETQRAAVPEFLWVAMSQHLGAPCEPVVGRGDVVTRGQLIGDVDALISAPVHAPVSGTVKAITTVRLPNGASFDAVQIEPDAEQDFGSWVRLESRESITETVRAAGIVGMGGAAFPSHVKLAPPSDTPIDTVIINGCECEPYLTCDDRTMRERADRVLAGARIIREAVDASRVVIGVEDNKPEAIEALGRHAGDDVEILSLPSSYPQGAEKQLIFTVVEKEVPHGQLPATTSCLVHNVGTAAAIADAVELAKPMMERVLTVSGAVARPGNYLALVGTAVSDMLENAGGPTGDAGRVLCGGPMTGTGIASLSSPITKGSSGVIVLPEGELPPRVEGDQPCIRCGRCIDACPMSLVPSSIGIDATAGDWDGTMRLHALDCIECGCCSYVCPTRRPLVQLLRLSKSTLLDRGERP
jgi:electron transport complex protein RnfC